MFVCMYHEKSQQTHDVKMTSYERRRARRDDVASTLTRRYFGTICPLGGVNFVKECKHVTDAQKDVQIDTESIE